jgi:hypothetical protein
LACSGVLDHVVAADDGGRTSAPGSPAAIFMVVDLPAPFGPRNPRTSPRSTVKLMPANRLDVAKAFRKSFDFNEMCHVIRSG